MISKNMIDIVTVVFQEELPVLQLQAQSIDIYCQNLGIKNIYVIVNDTADLIDQIDCAWWGRFQNCVQVIPREQFGNWYGENGWVSQQVLKLMGSSISQNTWTMILDAKTILVDHTDYNLFVIDSDHLTLNTHSILPVFQESANITGKLFGIEVAQVAEPSGVPFIFHNYSVKEMIAEINNRTNENFLTWFQKQGMLTEFILYSGYLTYKHKNLDQIYLGTIKRRLSNNVCHSQVKDFDRMLTMAKQDRPISIGVHRRAWAQLSAKQQQDYKDYLVSCGITTAVKLA